MSTDSFAKTCIHQSFMKLLSENTMESISITDIASKAGVSRTTFYRLYKTKEDLLKEIKTNYFNTSFSHLEKVAEGKVDEGYKGFFTLVYNNKLDVLTFIKAIHYNYEAFANPELSERLTRKDDMHNYLSAARHGALTAITIKWALNDFKESIDEMVEIAKSVTGYDN